MTTIHMDVDAMRRVQHSLRGLQGQIQDRIMPLRRNAQGLPQSWIANSANEYFDYYAEFDTYISSLIERLGDMASELSAEIARWERMDDGFAG